MRILLDTSAYSAFFRGHPGAVALVRRASAISLTPVVLGELLAGFRRGGRPAKNRAQLEELLDSPRANVVAMDEETARLTALTTITSTCLTKLGVGRSVGRDPGQQHRYRRRDT